MSNLNQNSIKTWIEIGQSTISVELLKNVQVYSRDCLLSYLLLRSQIKTELKLSQNCVKTELKNDLSLHKCPKVQLRLFTVLSL